METPIGDDDDSHLGDFIEDQSTVAPNEAAVYAACGASRRTCSTLPTPREAAGAAHALRHRDEHRPHARGGRQAVRRDARAHPADRSEGAAQAAASFLLRAAAELPRPGELSVRRCNATNPRRAEARRFWVSAAGVIDRLRAAAGSAGHGCGSGAGLAARGPPGCSTTCALPRGDHHRPGWNIRRFLSARGFKSDRLLVQFD